METRDVGHDVVGAAGFVDGEAGGGEDFEEALTLGGVGGGELVVVRLRRFEREGTGLLQRGGGADGEEVVDLADGLGGFGRSERPAYAPAGDAVGVGHAVDDDGAVAHAVDAGHRDVLRRVVENVLVDFIGDAEGVPADAEIADEFEFLASENFSRGVVRRVEDNRLGVRTEGGGQFPFVERPDGIFVGRWPHFDEARRGAGEYRVGAVIFVEGFEDHDLVAGIDDGHHGGHHGFGGAAADGDFAFGVIGDVLGAGKFFHDGVAQRLGAPGDGVLVDVVGDGLAGGLFYYFGGGEFGKILGEIDCVVLHGQAGHFTDDRFGELFGLGGEHPADDLGHVSFRCGHWEIVAKVRKLFRGGLFW